MFEARVNIINLLQLVDLSIANCEYLVNIELDFFLILASYFSFYFLLLLFYRYAILLLMALTVALDDYSKITTFA